MTRRIHDVGVQVHAAASEPSTHVMCMWALSTQAQVVLCCGVHLTLFVLPQSTSPMPARALAAVQGGGTCGQLHTEASSSATQFHLAGKEALHECFS